MTACGRLPGLIVVTMASRRVRLASDTMPRRRSLTAAAAASAGAAAARGGGAAGGREALAAARPGRWSAAGTGRGGAAAGGRRRRRSGSAGGSARSPATPAELRRPPVPVLRRAGRLGDGRAPNVSDAGCGRPDRRRPGERLAAGDRESSPRACFAARTSGSAATSRPSTETGTGRTATRSGAATRTVRRSGVGSRTGQQGTEQRHRRRSLPVDAAQRHGLVRLGLREHALLRLRAVLTGGAPRVSTRSQT